MPDYYDRAGKPMSLGDWAQRFEDIAYKRVGFDSIGDVDVSTVWLGLDHQFGDGPPLIFETLVFGDFEDEHGTRYSSEGQAIVGHSAYVDWVRAGMKAPEPRS